MAVEKKQKFDELKTGLDQAESLVLLIHLSSSDFPTDFMILTCKNATLN